MLFCFIKWSKLYKHYSLPPIMDNVLLSSVPSVFNSEHVKAYISNIKEKHTDKVILFESDYYAILAAILKHYFKDTGWVIAPEYWFNDKRRSDFVVFLPYIGQLPGIRYGEPIPKLMCESKSPSAIPWKDLVKEQLWNQASTVCEDHGGKLWVIAQIGFYICIFRFDLTEYTDSDWFTNFSPLNLKDWSEEDLDELEIKYIPESINGEDIIQVIQWDLREKHQYDYIHKMLVHITENDP